jgi:hypothetical protein
MIIDPLPSTYFPPIFLWYQRDISPGGGSIPFRCSWVNYIPAVTLFEYVEILKVKEDGKIKRYLPEKYIKELRKVIGFLKVDLGIFTNLP